LPEALARSHHDSVLSRPTRGQRSERRSFAQAIVRRLAARPSRTIAGAAFAAIMTGIVINALFLQKTHRFAVIAPPVSTAPAKTPPPAAPPAQAAAPADTAPAPPARPADLGALIEATAAPAHGGDPIRDLLRAEPKESAEAKRLTLAAQNALIKLGFAIKADGVDGASTRQAIQQFERSHGLIPLGEITPKLVRQLTAAGEAGR
jgi:hypothetical protein